MKKQKNKGGWLDKYEDGGSVHKAQNGIKETINKYLEDPYGEAREFAENPDELSNIDNMRHAQATRLTQEAIANKTGNIPLISDTLGFLGSNALGIGHELTTLFGDKDKRDWSTKLQEFGEDSFNNLFGSAIGTLPIADETKDNIIKYASYNNMLPDGYVRGKQGKKDGLSENVYFKNEDNEVRRPEYQMGGSVPKAQVGETLNIEDFDISEDQIRKMMLRDGNGYNTSNKQEKLPDGYINLNGDIIKLGKINIFKPGNTPAGFKNDSINEFVQYTVEGNDDIFDFPLNWFPKKKKKPEPIINTLQPEEISMPDAGSYNLTGDQELLKKGRDIKTIPYNLSNTVLFKDKGNQYTMDNGELKRKQTREDYRKNNLRPNGKEYQMGGSLPGASGMMYGRTSGNAPMEPGKLKKAQNGTPGQFLKGELKEQPPEPTWLDDLSDGISDFGTRTLNAITTFGGSAIGDAVNAISPEAAQNLEDYSAGFIPYTHEQDLVQNRSSNPERWNNRIGDTQDALFSAGIDAMTMGLFNKLPGGALAKGIKNDPTIQRTTIGKGHQTIQELLTPINQTRTQSALPKNMEPYLSRKVYPFNKEQEVFESFLSTDKQLKNINSKSINYDAAGNIIPNFKQGGVIKDNMGQWAHPGEITEISGNTMATHGYGDIPLYVVPDVGEPRMVQANTGTQTFPGATKFTEYPMAKNGSLVELNQLTNFTNYNTPQPGGWLDKYN
jgi:hypothetical protein